jgi:16S rRNA (cytosine967-C5)-methyltransferase
VFANAHLLHTEVVKSKDRKTKDRRTNAAVSSARAAAFEILLRIERASSYASDLLHSRTYARLSEIDHHLATELVMGVLRWQSLLDSEIAKFSAQPLAKLDLEVLTALRLALYQLRWLDRIPARAAIDESVELVKQARKRSAAAFVNAVLRKLASIPSPQPQNSQPTLNTSAQDLARSSAHPVWLVERWVHAYGIDTTLQICRYDQSIPTTTVRLRHPAAEEQLTAEGIDLASGEILASARKVIGGDVTKTAAFKNGLCAIQDEASQLVALLVGRASCILDCCAAPGGKTLSIADRNPTAEITAVDLHPHRARLLQTILASKNAQGERSRPIAVVTADARSLPFTQTFDCVLVDVPCSGTGTLARNPEIKWCLKLEDLGDLDARQLAILHSAMEHVSTRGRVIYSTCSLEKEENEDVVEHALAQDSSFRLIDCRVELERLRHKGELIWTDATSLTRGPYLRTIPGVHPCDGFFAAILEPVK